MLVPFALEIVELLDVLDSLPAALLDPEVLDPVVLLDVLPVPFGVDPGA